MSRTGGEAGPGVDHGRAGRGPAALRPRPHAVPTLSLRRPPALPVQASWPLSFVLVRRPAQRRPVHRRFAC